MDGFGSLRMVTGDFGWFTVLIDTLEFPLSNIKVSKVLSFVKRIQRGCLVSEYKKMERTNSA